MVVVAEELRTDGIHHGSRRIVETARQGTEIWNRHVIARLVVQRTIAHTRLPLGILQTLHALEIHDVGIGKLYAKRPHAMKVEQKMMSGSTFSHLVYGIDSLLSSRSKKSTLNPLTPISP